MTDLAINPQQLPATLSPGQLVGARYRLQRVAGAGGMATVWCAHDERLQRPVAIKVISRELASDPVAVTRFAREARMHARIQHPNLVKVYDYSVTAAQPYLVMEYIDGATLSERLDRGGFTAVELQTLAAELLSALACVHDHGVLHRDIKSANVLLDSEGHARLTDFGLARVEEAPGPRPGKKIVGTLRFLAPELLDGEPASRQSDLFALGVILRTVAAAAETPPQLSRVIAWLTQNDPKARPADARAALVALLSEPRVEEPPATRPATGTRSSEHGLHRQRILRPRPQRPVRTRNRAIAAVALLFAAAGTGFTLASAGGSPATGRSGAASRPRPAVATVHAKRRPTLEEQLQQLATGVKAASTH